MNKTLLTELFSTDEDLLTKYHILAPDTAENCASRTISDMKGNYVHSYEKDGEIIGYYGINGNQLTGFFIVPEHRNSSVLCDFWNKIESNFNQPHYFCGLYTKNTRAIEFIRKKSTEEFAVPTHDGIFFKIKRESKCL